jgi:hypothetical protein
LIFSMSKSRGISPSPARIRAFRSGSVTIS